MDKLQKLIQRCKNSVNLTVNSHRDYYETATDNLKEYEENHGEKLNIPLDVRKIMEETNTVINLQFYPDTAIGSYDLYHFDIDKILDIALEILGIE